MSFSLKEDDWVTAIGECERGEENQEKSSPCGTRNQDFQDQNDSYVVTYIQYRIIQ